MDANLVIGKQFPDLELPDHRGELVRLSKLAGEYPRPPSRWRRLNQRFCAFLRTCSKQPWMLFGRTLVGLRGPGSTDSRGQRSARARDPGIHQRPAYGRPRTAKGEGATASTWMTRSPNFRSARCSRSNFSQREMPGGKVQMTRVS